MFKQEHMAATLEVCRHDLQNGRIFQVFTIVVVVQTQRYNLFPGFQEMLEPMNLESSNMVIYNSGITPL